MSKLVNLSADAAPTKQAVALVSVSDMRSKTINKMVLLPNAEPMLPLSSLTGFVLSAKGELTLKDGVLLDRLRLFKGRAIVKVFDVLDLPKKQDITTIAALVQERITPVWFYEATVEAIKMALETVSLEALDLSNNLIPLARSDYVQSSAMLAENVADGDMFLIVDASASLSRKEDLDHVNGLFSGSLDEMMRSRIYKLYYRSVKAFRTHATLILRDMIVTRLFGVDTQRKKPGSLDVSHHETNLVKELKGGEYVIFSEAFDGEDGALIYAGPYHDLLWVNHASTRDTAQKIHKANLNDALPYDTPTMTSRFDALERIIMDRIKPQQEDDASEDEESAQLARLTALAPRKVHQRDGKPSIISVSSPSLPRLSSKSDKRALRLGAQYRAKELSSTLVWQESSSRLPVAVADELIKYHLPVEQVSALEKLGLDLDDEESVIPLRVFMQAITQVSTLDQLMIWRAAHSAAQRLNKQ